MRALTLPKLKAASFDPYKSSLILVAVVLLHLGVLWTLQNGAFKSIKPVEIVIPIALLPIHPVQLTATPSANAKSLQAEPLKSQSKSLPSPKLANPSESPAAAQLQAPAAISDKAVEAAAASSDTRHSAAHASSVSVASSAAIITVNSVASSATAIMANDAKPAKVLSPSTDADYLQNRKPKRSNLSEKMGEFGRVLIYAMISAEGLPLEAKVDKSSGFPRLDSSALEAVRAWRFKPGMVDGVPTTLPYIIPITFEL